MTTIALAPQPLSPNPRDIAPCHTVKIVQEWFEEYEKEFKVLAQPLNSLDLNKTSPVHGVPTLQLTGLKGSAANVYLPDTTRHLQIMELRSALFWLMIV